MVFAENFLVSACLLGKKERVTGYVVKFSNDGTYIITGYSVNEHIIQEVDESTLQQAN